MSDIEDTTNVSTEDTPSNPTDNIIISNNGKERRKIEIKFIENKTRRHVTFSKRKHGIMKKAFELSVLTGTQILLLVVSETGLVYTFSTPKFEPIVTQEEGRNLIQACLNAPDEEEESEEEIEGAPHQLNGIVQMPGQIPVQVQDQMVDHMSNNNMSQGNNGLGQYPNQQEMKPNLKGMMDATDPNQLKQQEQQHYHQQAANQYMNQQQQQQGGAYPGYFPDSSNQQLPQF